MLELYNIQTVIKEYDYEIVDNIYLKLSTGERLIKYNSDYFVGYQFIDIKNIFSKFNDILEVISLFSIESPIILISNKQAFLVNKKINSIISVHLQNGNVHEIDISSIFNEYCVDLDFFIRAHDMFINIFEIIRRIMYEEN